MTDGEKRLWSDLRDLRRHYKLHVRKQAPIGPYVVDFVIHERRLVIEVDGEHHFTPDGLARDRIRDDWFATQGYGVIRLSTGELSNSYDGCVEHVLHVLGLMKDSASTPTPHLPTQRGG